MPGRRDREFTPVVGKWYYVPGGAGWNSSGTGVCEVVCIDNERSVIRDWYGTLCTTDNINLVGEAPRPWCPSDVMPHNGSEWAGAVFLSLVLCLSWWRFTRR